MTTNLDRLEAIVTSNTLAIQALGQRIDGNAQAIADNTKAIADLGNTVKVLTEHQAQYAEQLRAEVTNLADMINTLAIQHGETLDRIDTIAIEVRGLQTENRRIIERWGNGNN